VKFLLASLLLAVIPAGRADGGERFACNMNALTKAERATHERIARSLLRAVQGKTELKDGYAFRLSPKALGTAAQWVALESRCCPFFAFAIEVSRNNGPVWLRITGPEGIKTFIQAELGL
jgi:hypothetical protein